MLLSGCWWSLHTSTKHSMQLSKAISPQTVALRPQPHTIPAEHPSIRTERGAAQAEQSLPASPAKLRLHQTLAHRQHRAPLAAAHINYRPFIKYTFDFRKTEANCNRYIGIDIHIKIHMYVCLCLHIRKIRTAESFWSAGLRGIHLS